MNEDDQHWRMLVYGMLRAGFGVEDISLKLRSMGMNPWSHRSIRDEVASLRRDGMLTKLLRGIGD